MEERPFPEEFLGHRDRRPVDSEACAAGEFHLQPRGGYDDIRIDRLSRRGGDACFCNSGNGPRHDVRVASPQSIVEVPVGRETESLLPGIVGRFEMRIVSDARGKFFLRRGADLRFRERGKRAAELEVDPHPPHELPPHQGVRHPAGEQAADPGRVVLGGRAEDVGWGALEHRYGRGRLGEDREERNGCCTGTDHDDLLVAVVERFGPELGMDCGALEALQAWDDGLERLVVIVIPRPVDHEPRFQLLDHDLSPILLAAANRDLEIPDLPLGRPVLGDELVVVLDVLVDPGAGSAFGEIRLDGWTVRDGIGAGPEPPGEPKGVEVGIGADAGVFEEIPRSSESVSGFEDRVGVTWQLGLDALGGVDACVGC